MCGFFRRNKAYKLAIKIHNQTSNVIDYFPYYLKNNDPNCYKEFDEDLEWVDRKQKQFDRLWKISNKQNPWH